MGSERNDNGNEQIEETAPVFPWEIIFRNSVTFFQRLPEDGMLLKFCALARTPMGNTAIPPGFVIAFDRAGWEHFQKEIAAGETIERVQIATAQTLPGAKLVG